MQKHARQTRDQLEKHDFGKKLQKPREEAEEKQNKSKQKSKKDASQTRDQLDKFDVGKNM